MGLALSITEAGGAYYERLLATPAHARTAGEQADFARLTPVWLRETHFAGSSDDRQKMHAVLEYRDGSGRTLGERKLVAFHEGPPRRAHPKQESFGIVQEWHASLVDCLLNA